MARTAGQLLNQLKNKEYHAPAHTIHTDEDTEQQRAEKQARAQALAYQQAYSQYKQAQNIDKVTNASAYTDSQYDLATQDALKAEAYEGINSRLKNRLTETNDIVSNPQMSEERSGLQNLNPFNLYKNVKATIEEANEAKQSLQDEYGLNTYQTNALLEQNKTAAKTKEDEDARNKIIEQYNITDPDYGKPKDDASRNYHEEIEYANNYLSEHSENPDELRNEVTAYLDADDAANEAEAGVSAESMSGNTTAADQAQYLRYNADNKAKAIMEKYGYTDEKEFKKLAQYVQELNDYDGRVEQQREAYNNVHTGSTAKNIAGGVANTVNALTANVLSGAGGVLSTIDYAQGQSKNGGGSYADVNSPLNANSQAMGYANAVTDYQGQTQQAISEKNKFLGILYGAGMSAIESAETSALGALGGESRVLTNALSLAPFAANAYATSLSENVTAGKAMGDAFADALVSAGIETGTEIFSVDKFWDVVKAGNRTARKVAVDFLVSSGIEGTEEMVGDIAELLVDRIKNGDDSEIDKKIKAYIANGDSEEVARAKARNEWIIETLEDGLSGALSGAMGGGIATAVNMASNASGADTFKNYAPEQYAELAESLDVDSSRGTGVRNEETDVNEGDDGWSTSNDVDIQSYDEYKREDDKSYLSKQAENSMIRAKELAEKYAKQDKASFAERLDLWQAIQDSNALENEAEHDAEKELSKAAKKEAKANDTRSIGQKIKDSFVSREAESRKESAGPQVYAGTPTSSEIGKGEVVIGNNGLPAITTEFRDFVNKQNRAASDKQIAEAIPSSVKVESNDSTPKEIHAEMAKATNISDLESAMLKGSASTNAETRAQVWKSFDSLAAKFNSNGITTEELNSLRRSDTDLYRAAFNGEDVKVHTTRQQIIANAATQNSLNAKAERNIQQNRANDAYVASISDSTLKGIASSNWKVGYNAEPYRMVLEGVANAQRTGMSEDEAWVSVKPFSDVVGADAGVMRAAAKAFYNRSVDIYRDEARHELERAIGSQAVKSFGKGSFEDVRGDKTDAIDGADVIKNFAHLTGLNMVVFDKGSVDKNSDHYDERVAKGVLDEDGNYKAGTNGWYRASDSTIYLNADEFDSLASTLAHELGEFASVWNPQEFQKVVQALQNAMIKNVGIKAFNNFRDSYKSSYAGEKGKTDADVDKEMANDLIYLFLQSEGDMRSFVNEVTGNVSEKQAKTILGKLEAWLKNLAKSLKDFFSHFDANAYQKAAQKAQIAQIDGLADEVHKALAGAVKNYQSAREVSSAVTVEESNLSPLTIESATDERFAEALDPSNKTQYVLSDGRGFVDDDGVLRMSLATYKGKDGTRALIEGYLKNKSGLSVDDQNDILHRLDIAYAIATEFDTGEYSCYSNWSKQELVEGDDGVPLINVKRNDGSPLRSVVVKNDEYPLNVDFSQVCKKRVAFNAVLNKLVNKIGINLPTLTESDYNYINQEIRNAGYEIACGMCFVESRRYRVGKWAEDFTGDYDKRTKDSKIGYNGLLRSMKAKDGSPLEYSYFNYTVNADPISPDGKAVRSINDLSEDEIDKSALVEAMGRYKEYDADGNIVGLKGTPTEKARMAWLLYSEPSERHLISNEEIISSDGLEYIRTHNKDLFTIVNLHGGASKAKAPLTQTAYGGEMIRSLGWPSEFKFTPESAAAVGGVRIQSFSDYEANMFFDYMQLFADMDAMRLTAHAYSKEWAFARLFGLTGTKINMSIIPRAISEDNKNAVGKKIEDYYNKHNKSRKALMDSEYGDYAKYAGINIDAVNKWIAENDLGDIDIGEAAVQMVRAGYSVKDVLLHQDNETFDLDKALAIQKEAGYSDNCGIIWIAVSDAQLRVLLEADEIQMVIPYHSSNINPAVKLARDLYLYKDYQPVQNTMYGPAFGSEKFGHKLEKGVANFDFYEALYRTGDPIAAVEEYKDWCDKNGYIPKFANADNLKDLYKKGKTWRDDPESIVNHPNYYKTIIDFRVYDYNGTDPNKVSARKYQKQMPVKNVLPDDARDIIAESLKSQQATMEGISRDVGADDGKLISTIVDHFKDRIVPSEDRHSFKIPKLDSEGNPLSDAQRKFYENSQAVGDDDRLKLMHHGSSSAGFVVFDPSMSDDGVSLFFTDDEEVAASYSGTTEAYNPYEPREELTEAEKKFAEAFGYPTDGSTSGNYSVYLNLENPLVVDYGGKKWDDYVTRHTEYRDDSIALDNILQDIDLDLTLWKVVEYTNLLSTNKMRVSLYDMIELYAEMEKGNGYLLPNRQEIERLANRIDKALDSGAVGVTWHALTRDIIGALYGDEQRMTTRDFARKAKAEGRDGVIFKNIIDIGSRGHGAVRHKASTVMVAFRSNQVKDIRNLEPTDADDMRYSVAIKDTNGTDLTEGQREYNAESKIKDEHNRLMVMHHGSQAMQEITTFSRGRWGYFFTDSKDVAESYASGIGRVYDVYLNVKNPLVVDYEGRNYDDGHKYDDSGVGYNAFMIERDFLRKVDKNLALEDVLGNWIDENDMEMSTDLTAHSLRDSMEKVIKWHGGIPVGKNGKEKISTKKLWQLADLLQKQLYDEGFYLNGNDSTSEYLSELMDFINDGEKPMSTDDWSVYAKRHGHDGVRFENIIDMGSYNDRMVKSTVVSVFDSNQIKWIGNENPTDDPDIRRSLHIEDTNNIDDADIEDSQYEVASILGAGAEILKDGTVNKKLCRSIAIEMKNKYSSSYDVNDLTDKLSKAFAYLQSGSNVNHADFVAIMDEIARLVVDEAYTPASAREDYADFRNKINGMEFSISRQQAAAIRSVFGSRDVFNKYYPEIHIKEGAPALDSVWADIVDASGYLVDEYTDHDDMVIALAQAFDDLKPTVGFEDATQMAHDMSLDIIARYLGNYRASGATKGVINEYTTKAANDIKTAHAEWKKQAEIKYAQRLAEERAYQKEIAKNRAEAQKGRTAEQIARLRAKNKERISDMREKQKKRAQIAQIRKTANNLYDMLTNPTDTKHIVKKMQEPVFEFLQAIDLNMPEPKIDKDGKWSLRIWASGEYDADGVQTFKWKKLTADTRDEVIAKYYAALEQGYGGKDSRKWYERMKDLANVYDRGGDVYDEKNSAEMSEFLQALDKDLADQFMQIVDNGAKGNKTSINDLSLDELKVLNAVARNVLHAVTYANHLYSQPSETVKGVAGDVMDHADNVNGRKNRNRRVEGIVDFLSLTNANPHTYLHAIGANKAIDILIGAQNSKAFKLREAQEVSKEILSAYTKDEIENLDNAGSFLGGKVVATKAQVMTIYELLQRPDATLHLLAGGFKVGSINDMTTTQNKIVHLTLDEYEALIGEALSDKDREVADKLQRFLAVNCAEWGNQTSMAVYGYEKFKDERYWPMKVVGDTTNTKTSEMMGGIANTIKNMGMTKATVAGASNPLLIDGAIDVYAKHVSDMAVYSAWTAPIQDLVRFFNYREKDDEGQVTRATKRAIESMFGTSGTEYFKKLMASIQGTEQSSFEDGGLVGLFAGNAKKAAVMANLRVAVQQPTAIYRAAKRIDGKYLNDGVVGWNGELEDLRKQMIGSDAVYWIKQQGNIDGYITQSIKSQITGVQSFNEKVTEKAGWLASFMDQVTWDAMYRSCISEQIDKMGKDKVGTQEFTDAVNYRFDHLMLETQVYDGTITRTQFMRSSDMYMKNASSFMAEPAKTYNIVLSDIIDYQQSKKGSEERADAKRQLSKTARVLFTTAAVNAFAQSVWDAVRNAGDPDEQDKDLWHRIVEAMGWDFDAETPMDQLYAILHGNLVDGLNILNNIPIISDMAEGIDLQVSKLVWDKSSYSSNDSMESAWITHLGSLFTALSKMAKDPDNNEVSGYGLFQKTARVISDIFGYPLYAAQRDAVAIYNQIGGRALGMPMISATKTSNKKQSKMDAYETIRTSSDIDEVRAAIDEAVEKGYTYKALNQGLKENLSEDLKGMSSSDATKVINRIAEVKAYLSDKQETNADKTHSQKVDQYKKDVKKWLE